ncbi:MAG: hypothetical protein ACYC99_11250, partial [Candidatus Geothermincolia bacterium]
MKMPARILIAVMLLSLFLAAGCGSSQTAQPLPSTSPITQPSDVVLGTWMVQGQPGTLYGLTFSPDGTYGLTYDGVSSQGLFKVAGTTVSLMSGGGVSKTLTIQAGADMFQDKLIEAGGVTWTR